MGLYDDKKPGDTLREMQTGQVPNEQEPIKVSKRASDYADQLFKAASTFHANEPVVEDMTQEAMASGYGLSRYDKGYTPGEDLENQRALHQSGLSKIVNGALKGGVTAGTTAVNAVAGTIVGAAVGAARFAEAVANDEEQPLRSAFDAGVNNIVSTTMTDIQKLSEKWFPNYRTAEERTDEYQREWIKHVFTPNFIGDSFLKNFGFTVGAIGGGMVWGKVLSLAARSKLANDLLKGVTAAAKGDAAAEQSLTTAIEALRAGNASKVQLDLIKDNIVGAAKRLNTMSATQMIIGSATAAMGEGVVEGVMARDEFMTEFGDKWNNMVSAAYEKQEENVLNSGNPDWVNSYYYINEEGVGSNHRELTEEGIAEVERRQRDVMLRYQELYKEAEVQGDRLATTTFALNMPILMASNTIQFGRMLSGGWKTARNLERAVNGGLRKEALGKFTGEFSGNGNKFLKSAANIAKISGTESAEEMFQGAASSGAQNVADARLTAFHDDGYDRGVARDYASWVATMVEGGAEYLGDIKNWQEGFMGMVTGLIGMPGGGYFKGKRGGIFEAIGKANEEVNMSREQAEKLNNLVNSKRFQKQWRSYARHNLYERQMENAIKKDDQYTWHTANDKQLINDIMTFADAGRLNDLFEIVDTYASMSDADAVRAGIIDAVKTQQTENDVDNNPTDTIETVRKHAKNFKDMITSYRETYDALRSIAPVETSDEHLQELVFTAMQTKRFEDRYFTILREVMDALEPVIRSNVEVGDENERQRKIDNALSNFTDIYSKLAIPTADDPISFDGYVRAMNWLREKTKDNKELSKKVDDLNKLAKNRRDFFNKFNRLQEITSEQFNEKANNEVKESKKLKKETIEKEASGYQSVSDVRGAVNSIPSNNEEARRAMLQDLSSIKDENDYVAEYFRLESLREDFISEYNSMEDKPESGSPVDGAVNYILNSVFDDSDSIYDLYNNYDVHVPVRANIRRYMKGIYGNNFGDVQIEDAINDAIAISRGLIKHMAEINDYHTNENNNPFSNGLRGVMGGQDDNANGVGPFSGGPRKQAGGGRSGSQMRKARPATQQKPTVTEDGKFKDKFGSVWSKGQEVYLYRFNDEGLPDQSTERKATIVDIVVKSNSVNAYLDDGNKSKIIIDLNSDDVARLSAKPIARVSSSPQPSSSTDNQEYVDIVFNPTPVEVYAEMGIGVDGSGVPEYASDAVSESDEMSGIKEIGYYHQSIPEIDSFQAKEARDIVKKYAHDPKKMIAELRKLNLGDFYLSNQGYEETWQALAHWVSPNGVVQNAFENIAWALRAKDDRVKFVIDPRFPLYNGKPQILVMKDGMGVDEDLILTVLHQYDEDKQTQYKGLKELADKIQDEYKLWVAGSDNDMYVFSDSKGNPYTSNVFLKRSGFVVYGKNEIPIGESADGRANKVPAYDKNAPIYFIGRNKRLIRMKGGANVDTKTLEETVEKLYTMAAESHPTGNLYYLAKDNNGVYSIPIRLNVEHFTTDTMMYSNDVIGSINSKLESFANFVSLHETDSADAMDDLVSGMRERVKDLSGLLDVHNLVFNIKRDEKSNDVNFIIHLNGEMVKANGNVRSTKAKDVSFEWLRDTLAKLRLSVNVNSDTDIERYIDSDIITTNADAMRPKGVDFCFNPWNGTDFSYTEETKKVEDAAVEAGDINVPEKSQPEPETPSSIKINFDGIIANEESETDDGGENEGDSPTGPEQVGSYIDRWEDNWSEWKSLPDDVKAYLTNRNTPIDQGLWDSDEVSDSDRKEFLKCPY